MKRKEFLTILKKNLSMLTSIDPSMEEEAEMMLATAENCGMLPPVRVRYVDQDNGNVICSEENTWEEEDEGY